MFVRGVGIDMPPLPIGEELEGNGVPIAGALVGKLGPCTDSGEGVSKTVEDAVAGGVAKGGDEGLKVWPACGGLREGTGEGLGGGGGVITPRQQPG